MRCQPNEFCNADATNWITVEILLSTVHVKNESLQGCAFSPYWTEELCSRYQVDEQMTHNTENRVSVLVVPTRGRIAARLLQPIRELRSSPSKAHGFGWISSECHHNVRHDLPTRLLSSSRFPKNKSSSTDRDLWSKRWALASRETNHDDVWELLARSIRFEKKDQLFGTICHVFKFNVDLY